MEYVKHLISCNCILPQFKYRVPIIFHRFIVFSEIDDSGDMVPCFAQCSNCGAIHKVTEVGQSLQLRKEELRSLPAIDDIRTALPQTYVNVLDSYKCDLTTWQELQFILRHEKWGRPIILYKEEADGLIVGKYLIPIGKDFHKIETFSREEDRLDVTRR